MAMPARMKRIAAACFLVFMAVARGNAQAQEFLPSPPPDKSLVYTLDEGNKLVPVAFERGSTPLNPSVVAKSTKVNYIEFKGEHSAITLNSRPRLFLFTTQKPGTHLPFLVWLTPRKGTRRVTAIAQRGLAGFGISSDEILK